MQSKSKAKEERLERSRGRGADWNSGAVGRFNRGTHRLRPPALGPAQSEGAEGVRVSDGGGGWLLEVLKKTKEDEERDVRVEGGRKTRGAERKREKVPVTFQSAHRAYSYPLLRYCDYYREDRGQLVLVL